MPADLYSPDVELRRAVEPRFVAGSNTPAGWHQPRFNFIAGENISSGEPVRLQGDYMTVANCYINDGLEITGNNVIVTGCMVYGAEGAGISITDPDQHKVQINTEDWPANAVPDINNGRATLQARGFVGIEPMLVASSDIIRTLDELIANTQITYRQALFGNDLLSNIYEVSEEEDNGEPCAVLVVDREANDIAIPVINREFFLNWREIGTTPERASTKQRKFSEKIDDIAWRLLEEYMTGDQYHAFVEGTKIELQNQEETYRLLIDKKGDFMILQEKTGSGIVSSSGRIRSYDYPLGDEIAAFMDWFTYKTEELISQWACGTYGIVKEGQRR